MLEFTLQLKNLKILKSLLDVDELLISGSDKNSSTGSSSTNSFLDNLSTIGSLFNSC